MGLTVGRHLSLLEVACSKGCCSPISVKHSLSFKVSIFQSPIPRTLSGTIKATQRRFTSRAFTLPPPSLFESTIRYLGGLLSAYELTGQNKQFLVDKAKQLADQLSVAWAQVRTMSFRHDSTRFSTVSGKRNPIQRFELQYQLACPSYCKTRP